jgi:O-antigen/teichoic acid export membrane protein
MVHRSAKCFDRVNRRGDEPLLARTNGPIRAGAARPRLVLRMFVWSTFWMGTSVPNVAWGPISFVLIGMTVVGSFVLYRYVRDRADMPGRRLDEREKELRDRAWILSYQVLSAVVVAAVILIGIAVFVLGRAVTFDASLVNAIVLSVAVLLPILPAAALAWIEPDPVEEA